MTRLSKSEIKHIRIASDLHLEAFGYRDPESLAYDFLPPDPRDDQSILVLAGDISSEGAQLLAFLVTCCKRWPWVYFVAGNHEFYRHDYKRYSADLKSSLLSKTSYGDAFDNLEFAIDDVGYEEHQDLKLRFIFCPLWADGGLGLHDQAITGRFLNDFRLITNMEGDSFKRFTVQDMMRIHKKQKAKIAEYLAQPFDGRSVVITHHLPSRKLVSARFWPADGSDGANGGFVGACDDILYSDHAPWQWIHGHTHDSISTTINATRIDCNPCGYRGEWSTQFNTYMTVETRTDGSKRVIVAPRFIDL
jgi:hypothetical protein